MGSFDVGFERSSEGFRLGRLALRRGVCRGRQRADGAAHGAKVVGKDLDEV